MNKKLVVLVSALLLTFGVWAYQFYNWRVRMDAPTWAAFTTQGDQYHIVDEDPSAGYLPSMLIINGEEWSIVKVKNFDANGDAAETYCRNKTIAYIPTMLRSSLRINMMHEVFHAGACLHGGDKWWNSEHPTDLDHPGIYHLGDFTSNFIHDNPEFIEWMMDDRDGR